MEHYGLLTLLPTIVVLVLALLSQRTIESVIAGSLVAFIITDGWGFLGRLSVTMLEAFQSETNAWVLLVCGLYGSFIALLVRGGGAQAFGDLVAKRVNGKKGSLLCTWLLGLVIFLDDYLNSLTVSSSMKKVTDKFKVSREMLAYVVDSTAAPICLLVPISTWAVYYAGLLEKNGLAESGQGMSLFIDAIPYMFYPVIAVLMVPLVITGVIPLLGKMKAAEHRAETTGQLAPEHSEHNEVRDTYVEQELHNPNSELFFIPIITLIFFTIWFDIDLLMGVIAATMATVLQYWLAGVLKLSEIFDTMMDGLKTMLPVLVILISVFVLIEANNHIGFTAYIIEHVTPLMSPKMLPVVTFVSMAFVSFVTGSNWGVFAIAFPAVFPLAVVLDVNIPLVAGALLSASGFGSQACFYSDSTVLSAQGSGCGTLDHALSQLPYVLIAAGVSALGFYWVA
ncbi:sodium:proton antiporter [Dasania sp. GY-MA-18]|uniref:Sodium:proton antiporter n=1 Tax=Dasania phycosphaerae TaxID=2950436 RepID=A0A9J6RLI7_9GAMM|nr:MULTISPECIES: Na+/H+ antiporter NhaC family protein [Dasania]MCR8922861.1 sodium:proton antiporter [Dasania sp. GY-MA-18]MCZ0865292.1 sodium:proton antiporter [Dasania phycosphaerae]MCZ0869017.1 sodium:proton antiporter [Dasania phycosphaerae]